MKKTYINPELMVVNCETQGMLALSGELDAATEIIDSEDFGSRELDEFDEMDDYDEDEEF